MPGFPLAPVSDCLVRVLLADHSLVDLGSLAILLEKDLPGVIVEAMNVSLAVARGGDGRKARRSDHPSPSGLSVVRLEESSQVVGHRGSTALLTDDYQVHGRADAAAIAAAVLVATRRRSAEVRSGRYQRLALSLLDALETPACAVEPAGRIVAVNTAWSEFAADNGGDPDRTGVGMSYLAVADEAAAAGSPGARDFADGLRKVLDGREGRFSLDGRCDSPEQERWFTTRVSPLPERGGAVVVHTNTTGARLAERELTHQALHDALTGLPNRNLLNDRLARALAWAARAGQPTGVGLFGLDGFKRVNESLGHAAGDELLVAVAGRLAGLVDGIDTLAKADGDQFVAVWIGSLTGTAYEDRARQLMRAFDEPFVLEGASVHLTASVGVAVGADPQTAEDLLLAAAAAMDDAKTHGRGRVRMFTPELRVGADRRLLLEQEMRAGLAKDQLVLYYQPVIDLQSRKVTGVEALVRWQHPEGLRMPDTFIPLAEASGLIVPLGEWVLDEACRQGARWAREGLDLDIAVNLSARQLSDPDIVEAVADALRKTGLNPARLEVEVTESTVVQDAEGALLALRQIVALGVRVAIDDFGTGYSSLLYLKRYPLSALKVDRSFVAGIGLNADDDAIVASVVSLAHAVGAVCIAEGVETVEQHQALLALGCRYAQGYLFSRPVPAAELPQRIEECNLMLSADAERPIRPHRRWNRAVAPRAAARIRQLRREGASLHTVAAALNQEGILTDNGGRWVSAAVAEAIATEPGSVAAGPRP